MKRRIEQILNGIFEYEAPELILSSPAIQERVTEGYCARGTFSLENAEKRKMKGFIYSDNMRVLFEPAEFQGASAKIQYQMDTTGLEPASRIEGSFYICSDLGTASLPYTITVVSSQEQEQPVRALSLEELCTLAETEYERAWKLYQGSSFRERLKRENARAYQLCCGLDRADMGRETLDVFLTGCGCKENMVFTLEQKELEFPDLTQTIQEKVTLIKSGWGFKPLSVWADAPFIRIPRPEMTTDDFVGSQYQLEFLIDVQKLHDGRNFGRIFIRAGRQTLQVELSARGYQVPDPENKSHIQKLMLYRFISLYIDFQLRKIERQDWLERAGQVLKSYARAGGDPGIAALGEVKLYYEGGEDDRAREALKEIGLHREWLKSPEAYGAFLYLTARLNDEIGCREKMLQRIEELYLQNPGKWLLRWLMFGLADSFRRNPHQVLEGAEEQFNRGCRSPLMYLTIYQLLKKDPPLLRKIGDFERQVLNFIIKHQVMTAELARQVGDIAVHQKEYQEGLVEILAACYEKYLAPELVRAICILLILGEKREPEYFIWYKRGVEAGLKITGLYEYYLDTMQEEDIRDMPQIIRLYFSYNHSLEFQKKACIYRNMIAQKDKEPGVFRNFRPAMEKFMIDQLAMGRINADLAVIYRTFLTREVLNRSMARQLAGILFTCEVTCADADIRALAVRHPQLNEETVVRLTGGKAQVRIYTEDACILGIDREGRRCSYPGMLEVRPLFFQEEYLSWCKALVPEEPGLVLHVCASAQEEITEEEIGFFCTLCRLETVAASVRREARKRVFTYYLNHPRDESLYAYLQALDMKRFSGDGKEILAELLAREGMCREAFALIRKYGTEGISTVCLVRIVSRMVMLEEYQEDETLVQIALHCFTQGKYDTAVLTYLLLHYEGPIERMKELWRAGRQFELDTMYLEEKILTLLLFTRTGEEGTEEIFDAYRKRLGRKKLCDAYVTLMAYEYFVRKKPVEEPVFQYIELSLEKGRKLEDVCRLAWLKKLSGEPRPLLTAEKEQLAGELLDEFLARGLRFGFYQSFEGELLRPYQLADKVFVEYCGNPESTVTLYYRKDGEEEYTREPLKNTFEGIYVKEFILFYREKVEYYLTEEKDGRSRQTDTAEISGPAEAGEGSSSYDLINRLIRARQNGDTEAFQADKDTYIQQEYLAEKMFTLI